MRVLKQSVCVLTRRRVVYAAFVGIAALALAQTTHAADPVKIVIGTTPLADVMPAYIAKEKGFSVVVLAPAKARAAGLPRSVPLADAGDARARLKAGLEQALAVNDRLSLYQTLLEDLAANRVSDRALAALG